MSNLAKKLKLGATGAYPDGNIGKGDQGALRLAIANDGKLVRVEFGKPVAWLALPPGVAKELAALLMRHAAKCQQSNQ